MPLIRATRRSLPRLNSPDKQIPPTAAAMKAFRTIPIDDIHNSQVKHCFGPPRDLGIYYLGSNRARCHHPENLDLVSEYDS
ncbi:hypothetical protein [Catenulispora acidiphila]|uniref:hypothetical protein n=1 Tax=Catenulispora acidiphila TaxID=304895 RepID=UPI00117CFDCC|nr:hypothetical protein [Catenulispora acidiphila]